MSTHTTPPSHKRYHLKRLMLLLAAIGVGLVVGLLGFHYSASQMWFLAIPGAIALVWLFVANPEECCCSSTECRRDEFIER